MNAGELSQFAADVIEHHRREQPSASELAALQLTPFGPRGNNLAYRADGCGRIWFVKFCKNDANRIPDICEREVLVSLLGAVLRISVVRAWLIPASSLTLGDLPQEPLLIRDKCVIMPMLDGSAVRQSKDEAAEVIRADLKRVANLFAFMQWVGDEDRGLADIYLANGDLVLIDNGLCGPGRDALMQGAHPYPEQYRGNQAAIVKKCNPGKPSLVAFILRDLRIPARELQRAAVIEDIEVLPDNVVLQIVEAAGLSPWIADVLILRRPLLRHSYLEWLSQAVQVCSYS